MSKTSSVDICNLKFLTNTHNIKSNLNNSQWKSIYSILWNDQEKDNSSPKNTYSIVYKREKKLGSSLYGASIILTSYSLDDC